MEACLRGAPRSLSSCPSLDPALPPGLRCQKSLGNTFFHRALWNRVFSVALFVEHVLLETQSQIPELSQLVTKHVFLLDKVSTRLTLKSAMWGDETSFASFLCLIIT